MIDRGVRVEHKTTGQMGTVGAKRGDRVLVTWDSYWSDHLGITTAHPISDLKKLSK